MTEVESDNSGKKYKTIYKKWVKAQFNASIAVTVNKNDHNEVYLQIAAFNGKLIQKGNKKIMNLVLTPKNTRKLMLALAKGLELQWKVLKTLGYAEKDTQVNTR